jgi:hypothetical protein
MPELPKSVSEALAADPVEALKVSSLEEARNPKAKKKASPPAPSAQAPGGTSPSSPAPAEPPPMAVGPLVTGERRVASPIPDVAIRGPQKDYAPSYLVLEDRQVTMGGVVGRVRKGETISILGHGQQGIDRLVAQGVFLQAIWPEPDPSEAPPAE